MKVYETIISILEKKGHYHFLLFVWKLIRFLKYIRRNRLSLHKFNQLSQEKGIYLQLKAGKISIHPDKYPFSLIATMEEYSGVSNQVRVNFMKKRFIFLEWRNKDNIQPFADYPPKFHGSLEDFKREIYSMKIWEWEPAYRNVRRYCSWRKVLVCKIKYQRQGL